MSSEQRLQAAANLHSAQLALRANLELAANEGAAVARKEDDDRAARFAKQAEDRSTALRLSLERSRQDAHHATMRRHNLHIALIIRTRCKCKEDAETRQQMEEDMRKFLAAADEVFVFEDRTVLPARIQR